MSTEKASTRRATKAQVFAACDVLASDPDREKFSLEDVRDYLDGGSFSTLGPLVSLWRKQASIRKKIPTAPALLVDQVLTGVEELFAEWQGAFQTAKKELTTAADEAIAELAENLGRSEGENLQLREDLKARDAEAELLRAEVETVRMESSALAESLSASDLRNERLQADVARTQSERDGLRSELDAMRKDMGAQRERFQEESALLRDNAAKEKAELAAQASTERDKALQALRVELEAAHRQSLDEQHQRLVRDHESRLDSLREEIKEERKESYRVREAMQERMLMAQEELRRKQTEFDAAIEDISQLRTERDQLRDEALAAMKAQERLMGQIEALRLEKEATKKTPRRKGD